MMLSLPCDCGVFVVDLLQTCGDGPLGRRGLANQFLALEHSRETDAVVMLCAFALLKIVYVVACGLSSVSLLKAILRLSIQT